MRRIQPLSRKEWLGGFTAALQASDLAPLTRRAYSHDILLFARWLEEMKQPLSNLCTEDLLAYRQRLVNFERLRPATINQRLHAIRWLCRWAHRRGMLAANPALEVKTVRVPARRRPTGLEEPEVHALLRAAGKSRASQRQRNYAIVQFLLQAGVRVGELVSLRVEDVTLRARSGHVRIHGKGGKEREVPLNATARRAIRAYLEQCRSDADPKEPLFLSHENRALSERSVQTLLTTLARRANIHRIRVTPHTLRHTFATTYLRENPGKLVQLANLLGHESLDTTSIYTQPSAEELAADLEKSRHNVYG